MGAESRSRRAGFLTGCAHGSGFFSHAPETRARGSQTPLPAPRPPRDMGVKRTLTPFSLWSPEVDPLPSGRTGFADVAQSVLIPAAPAPLWLGTRSQHPNFVTVIRVERTRWWEG